MGPTHHDRPNRKLGCQRLSRAVASKLVGLTLKQQGPYRAIFPSGLYQLIFTMSEIKAENVKIFCHSLKITIFHVITNNIFMKSNYFFVCFGKQLAVAWFYFLEDLLNG